MKPIKLSEVANWSGGELLRGVPSDTVSSFTTDTRKMKGGELFVALKGDNFDAHDHLQDAIEKGAACLLVHALPAETENCDVSIIKVRNSLTALQLLAQNYRRELGIPVVGITGSSGKTSTKDLTRAVLSQKFNLNATAGNLNNHIGVPLTVLTTEPEHELLICEMGMSNPGEIEVLAEIAAPSAGIITNVGTAHLEHMGSRDAIGLEKGMLAEALPSNGCVILSAHDDYTESIRERTNAGILTAGVGCGDVSAQNLEISFDGCRFDLSFDGETVATSLAVPAQHMVRNATLAAATGLHFGMTLGEVAAGLASAELTGGRLQRKMIGNLAILDDSYNANPDSVRAAIRTMRDLPVEGRRIAILGLMAEIGEGAEAEHHAIGQFAAENGIDLILGIGLEGEWFAAGAGSGVDTKICADHAEIAEFLKANAQSSDLILVKGSRSARMETVLDHFSHAN